MVSFDVESLFTNIPLEAIDLAIQAIHYIGEGNHDLKLTKPNLKQLFWLVTAHMFLLMVTFMIKLLVWRWVLPSPPF